jgi:hypothetical protein
VIRFSTAFTEQTTHHTAGTLVLVGAVTRRMCSCFSLPAELWIKIFRAAVDHDDDIDDDDDVFNSSHRFSFRPYHGRVNLSDFVLVSRQWRCMATPVLYETVNLSTSDALLSFITAINKFSKIDDPSSLNDGYVINFSQGCPTRRLNLHIVSDFERMRDHVDKRTLLSASNLLTKLKFLSASCAKTLDNPDYPPLVLSTFLPHLLGSGHCRLEVLILKNPINFLILQPDTLSLVEILRSHPHLRDISIPIADVLTLDNASHPNLSRVTVRSNDSSNFLGRFKPSEVAVCMDKLLGMQLPTLKNVRLRFALNNFRGEPWHDCVSEYAVRWKSLGVRFEDCAGELTEESVDELLDDYYEEEPETGRDFEGMSNYFPMPVIF